MLAETAADLAAATDAVLDAPELAASLTAAAYTFVRRHHDLPVMAEQVRALVAAAAGGRPSLS